MTIQEFITNHKLIMTSEVAVSNPNIEDSWKMNNWLCTIRMGQKRIAIHFSQGLAIDEEPTLERVLECLASDSYSYENSNGFEDWADDLGFSSDSRKAERTYRAVEKESKKLLNFLGAEAYEVLLSVEPE